VEDQTQVDAVSAIVVGMNLRRSILVVVLLGAVAVLLSLSMWRLNASAPAAPPRTRMVAADQHTERALRILRDWDSQRTAAWAAGDLAGLARLYLPGSAAGAADVGWLQQYVDRGLVVDRIRMQLLSVELTQWSARRFTLVVTDRLAVAEAVDAGGGRHPLPRDQATTSSVTLARDGDRWRVV
jgi:hypothetical protein